MISEYMDCRVTDFAKDARFNVGYMEII